MSIPALESFPVVLTQNVLWGDMDALQHVNNTVYFRYFEDVRLAYFQETGILDAESLEKVGPILASIDCRFKAPLTYPDTLHIGTRVYDLKEDRFRMEYVVYSEKLQRIAATGHGLVVSYNYVDKHKASVPQSWLQQIERLEGHLPLASNS